MRKETHLSDLDLQNLFSFRRFQEVSANIIEGSDIGIYCIMNIQSK